MRLRCLPQTNGRLQAASRSRRVTPLIRAVAAPERVEAGEQHACGPYSKAVVLQGFNYASCEKPGFYETLKAKAERLKAAGITHVWLPPPSQSASPQGYLPTQLYNLDSRYGTKQQLVELNAALKEQGIKPIADLVLNHRSADDVDSCGIRNRFRDDVDHEGRRIDWGKWAITGNDPQFKGRGNPDTGDDFGAAPDLDHLNEEVRAALKHWMSWLQADIGFEGWRLDFANGYGAYFVSEYVDATSGLNELNIGDVAVELEAPGGVLAANQDAARQHLVDWIEGCGKRACAMDFPTQAILSTALERCELHRLKDSQGKAPGLIGWWPSKALTFVDHDGAGSAHATRPFPADHLVAGYAYVLTHPGVPCILATHLLDAPPEVARAVTALARLRVRAGLGSESKLHILKADRDCYLAKIDDKVLVQLGPAKDIGPLTPRESEGWLRVVSGPDYTVWEKTANDWEAM